MSSVFCGADVGKELLRLLGLPQKLQPLLVVYLGKEYCLLEGIKIVVDYSRVNDGGKNIEVGIRMMGNTSVTMLYWRADDDFNNPKGMAPNTVCRLQVLN